MILLENVTKEYDLPTGKAGQLIAADRLTLEVPAGEVFGLVDPNGAGKTTTLKMVRIPQFRFISAYPAEFRNRRLLPAIP